MIPRHRPRKQNSRQQRVTHVTVLFVLVILSAYKSLVFYHLPLIFLCATFYSYPPLLPPQRTTCLPDNRLAVLPPNQLLKLHHKSPQKSPRSNLVANLPANVRLL